MEQQEAQVISAWKEGNEPAFEMIFRSHYESLCRYAYTFLRDREEAEEVVQGTFINLWDKRGALDIQSSLKSYLFRAVRNSCLNALKHEKIKQQHVAHELAVMEVSHESVSEAVAAAELEQRIAAAMRALPEQCRLVFQLSRFEELKYQEIADQLDISVKTVENHMGKALRLMREQLSDYLVLILLIFKNWW
ncbi:MAG: RNA polymerase sigma-70 factor [Cyclobacteriaceae bacterium]